MEKELRHCPHCKMNLRDFYDNPLEVGVEIRQLYDGVAYWHCPLCGGAWTRQGTPLSKQETRELTRGDIFTK